MSLLLLCKSTLVLACLPTYCSSAASANRFKGGHKRILHLPSLSALLIRLPLFHRNCHDKPSASSVIERSYGCSTLLALNEPPEWCSLGVDLLTGGSSHRLCVWAQKIRYLDNGWTSKRNPISMAILTIAAISETIRRDRKLEDLFELRFGYLGKPRFVWF